MLLAGGIPWLIQLRMVATAGIGRRTNAAQVGARLAARLAAESGGNVAVVASAQNPWSRISDRNALFASDSTIEVSAVVQSSGNFDTSVVCRAFAGAVKDSGNPSFSVDRIVSAFPETGGCGAVDRIGLVASLFGDGEYIARVCIEASRADSLVPPAPPGGATDTAVATLGHVVVRDSSQNSEVGTQHPGVGAAIGGGVGDVWAQIPTGVKVGAGVVGGVVLLVSLAYVLRSVR